MNVGRGRCGGEKPLREEEKKEKIMRFESALKENQASPRDNSHEGRGGKNCVDWWSPKRRGPSPLRRGLLWSRLLAAQRSLADLEYIDSVHHHQRGVITSGIM